MENCSSSGRFVKINECTVVKNRIIIDVNIINVMKDVSVEIAIKKLDNGNFIKFLKPPKVDWCELMSKKSKKSNVVLRGIVSMYKDYIPELFHPCPFQPQHLQLNVSVNNKAANLVPDDKKFVIINKCEVKSNVINFIVNTTSPVIKADAISFLYKIENSQAHQLFKTPKVDLCALADKGNAKGYNPLVKIALNAVKTTIKKLKCPWTELKMENFILDRNTVNMFMSGKYKAILFLYKIENSQARQLFKTQKIDLCALADKGNAKGYNPLVKIAMNAGKTTIRKLKCPLNEFKLENFILDRNTINMFMSGKYKVTFNVDFYNKIGEHDELRIIDIFDIE
ncbi:hypothetical protein PVAND_016513 [Polypedilum vanderplanki]|uniref:Uncharacterized protein n=1 Tax=Polypedilum vanderplanki TaxID=319348 RepID=A0A9J6BG06_POLVA|nr:hypothetical protein PVAND_016513 [Polypedilum vanderplanki]